jgi:hypothetical protein
MMMCAICARGARLQRTAASFYPKLSRGAGLHDEGQSTA